MNLTTNLFGQFQILAGGEIVSELRHPRLQELLAYLLLHRDRSLPRQQLAFLFWPESSEEQARTNLRNLLYRLRRALPIIDHYLRTDETNLRWRKDLPLSLDTAEFEASALPRASSSPQERIRSLEHALSLYAGDLLPDCYSDWLLAERERLRQIFLDCMISLAELYEDQRLSSQAAGVLQQIIRHDPLNENAYAWLMRLHAAEGRRGQALQVYHTCVKTLRSELGVEPCLAVSELYSQILENESLPVPAAESFELVGRQTEWQQLTQAWRSLLSGRRQVQGILISGEAGVGKTYLSQAFGGWVQRQGYTIVKAASYENNPNLAYAPPAVWLASLYEQNRRAFNELPPVIRSEVSRLLPELRLNDPALDPPMLLSEKWQILNFYESLARAVRAAKGPILLILDDIQWCDAETLAWLAYLFTHKGAEKLLLMATARSEAAFDHPAVHFFNQLDHKLILPLEPLDFAGTRQLIEQMLGGPVDDSQARALYRLSEGNCLFVTEMVRASLHLSSEQAAHLPERVQTVIHWRLNRLSPQARQIIDLASVIGRNFTYDLLQSAAQMDERSLVDGLDEAWRVRLLREQGSQSYDFCHDLVRLEAYESLSQARRRFLHGVLAEALSQAALLQPGVHSSAAARHYAASGQVEKAALHYEKAAQCAKALFAVGQAEQLLREGLAVLSGLPTPRGLAARLYEQLAWALSVRGEYDESRRSYALAAEHLQREDAESRARLLRQTAEAWSAQQRYNEAGEALSQALEILGSQPEPGQETGWRQEWLEIHLKMMDRFYFLNKPEQMEQISALIEDPLNEHGSLEQQSEYFGLLGMLANRCQRFFVDRKVIALVTRSFELAEKIGNRVLTANRRFSLGFNLLWYGSLEEAAAHLEIALAEAEKLGSPFIQCRVLAYLGITRRMQGQVEQALQVARRGLELAESQQHAHYQGVGRANLGWLAYKRGDLEEAARLSNQAMEFWQGGYPMEWLARFPLAAIACERGDIPAARLQLQAALSESQQRLPSKLEEGLQEAVAPGEPEQAWGRISRALDTARILRFL